MRNRFQKVNHSLVHPMYFAMEHNYIIMDPHENMQRLEADTSKGARRHKVTQSKSRLSNRTTTEIEKY
jgi:hypothetical protein